MYRRYYSLVVAAVLLALAGLASATRVKVQPTQDPREQVWRYLSLSQDFMFERNYEEAENNLRRALVVDPDNIIVLNILSRVLVQRGRDEDAKALAVRVEALYPKASPAEQFLVSLESKIKAGEEGNRFSEAKLKEIEKLYPNDFLTHYAGAYYYFQRMNNFPAAIDRFEKTLALAPWMIQAHNVLGYLYTYVCRYDQAIRHLEAYARFSPDRANPHDSLGEVYFMTGRYEDSIREFQSAIAISPTFTDAHYHLIDAYNATGQYDNAMRQTLKMFESSDSPEYKTRALLSMSLIYQFKGNLTAARAKAVAAGELEPSWPGPMGRLALTQIEEGDIPGVQKTLELWQKTFPPNANGKKSPKDDDLKIRYDFIVAKMNAAMGNFQAAIRLFQRVSEGIPIPHRSIDVRRELAEAYFATGQSQRAREILAQILEINPRHVPSLILAAKIAASLSKNEEARGYLARCDDVLKQADQRTPQLREVAHLQRQVK